MNTPFTNAKTPVQVLHEYCTQRHETPNYNLICNGVGTHEPIFKYEVRFLNKVAIGSGSSKKQAKHEAARLLMCMINSADEPISLTDEQIYSPYDGTVTDNAVGALQEYSSTYQLKNPVYKLIREVGPPHSKQFTMLCSVSSLFFEATARTKKQAKHRCATGLLDKLKSTLSCVILENPDCSLNKSHGLSTGDVVDRLKTMSLEDRTVMQRMKENTLILGIAIRDICQLFQSNHYPTSDYLKSLKNNSENELNQLEDPESSLELLANDLNFSIEINEIPSINPEKCLVNVSLLARPCWSFIRLGSDYESAKRKSIIAALKFLIIMS